MVDFPKPGYESWDEVDKDLAKSEGYLSARIKEDFPSFGKIEFMDYRSQDEDTVGLIKVGSIIYSFLLEKGSDRPVLQRQEA